MGSPATIGEKTVTILDGASLSDGIRVQEGTALVGIVTPSGWDTAALSLAVAADGIRTDPDDATYVPLLDQTGTEWDAAAVAASRAVAVPAELTLGFRFLKVRSGTSGAAVNQSGTVVLTLLFRRIA